MFRNIVPLWPQAFTISSILYAAHDEAFWMNLHSSCLTITSHITGIVKKIKLHNYKYNNFIVFVFNMIKVSLPAQSLCHDEVLYKECQ